MRIFKDALFHKAYTHDICFYAQKKTIKYSYLGVLVIVPVESLEKSKKSRRRLYFMDFDTFAFSRGKAAENFWRFVQNFSCALACGNS